MKLKSFKIVLIFLLSLICFNVSRIASTDYYYKVLKVLDGDKFYIDFNSSGTIESNERVRVNGIDAFEIKMNETLQSQAKNIGISYEEALRLGYLGKKYAEKTLLNKKVKISYTAKERTDRYGRAIVSIYYDCDKDGNCKSYEKEMLKEGLAVVYPYSNLRKALKSYENIEKIKENAMQSNPLVILNLKNKKYHKLNCKYGQSTQNYKLVKLDDLNKQQKQIVVKIKIFKNKFQLKTLQN